MEISIKDNLNRDIFMDRELIFGRMRNTQDNGKTLKWMGKEFLNGTMGEDIVDNIDKG